MINTSTVPTDNLYKFLALSGLSAAVVLMVSLELTIHDISIKASELKALLTIVEKETARHKTEDAKGIESDNPIETNRYLRYLEHLEDLERGMELNKTLLANFRSFRIVSYLFILTFILQSIFGFTLWYHKLQKYQDAILKNEANIPDEKS